MKLQYDEPLSNFAFKFNLRRYAKGAPTVRFLQQAEAQYAALAPVLAVQKAYLANRGLRGVYKVGRCRLTPDSPQADRAWYH